MVSKFIKRTPPKSIKDNRNHHHHYRRCHRRKKTPIKNLTAASSALISSINKSLHSCQRRLIKIFTKLARIATPKSNYQKGYRILKKTDTAEDEFNCTISSPPLRRSLFNEINNSFDDGGFSVRLDSYPLLLPPLIAPNEKRTVILDLDETLVHSKTDPPPEKFDFIVRPVIKGEILNFYVLIRPGVEEFLEAIGGKYEVVVFTAGLREYASLVLDRIDRKGVISHRLYRDSCREKEGKFVKDLSLMGREMKNVVIVDDNPNAYELHPENAIPIKPFINDLEDNELGRLVKFFETCNGFDDIRDAVKLYVHEKSSEGSNRCFSQAID